MYFTREQKKAILMSLIWITKVDGEQANEETEYMVRTVYPKIGADSSVLYELASYDQSQMFEVIAEMNLDQKNLVKDIWVGAVRADKKTRLSEVDMYNKLCNYCGIEAGAPFSQEEILQTILENPFIR